MNNRIKKLFIENKKNLLTFVTGGDPDLNTSFNIIKNLPNDGADLIEIGMPFSDPMADGPTIQASSNRAIKKDTKLIMNFYNSEPAGLIKLDLLKKNQYGISINLNPDYRGMNLSTGFIRDSINRANIFSKLKKKYKNIVIFFFV